MNDARQAALLNWLESNYHNVHTAFRLAAEDNDNTADILARSERPEDRAHINAFRESANGWRRMADQLAAIYEKED